MNALALPQPVRHSLRTPGVAVLTGIAGAAVVLTVYRFLFGLGSVTNLDNVYPWGLWKAFNVVTGIAIAAGGFTTAAFVEVFHRRQFRAIARPALLAAALGYTFAVLALIIDLGRYYSIWHPILPSMWQGDSVLFEVAMCVMCYLTILYIEFFPVVRDATRDSKRFPRLSARIQFLAPYVSKALYLLIPAGVVVSCLHQSSLGNLMVIAPGKMHPLWFTPILSMLFLMSAIAVGFPAVILASIYSAWALQLRPDVRLLSGLARYVPPIIGVYLGAKVCDVVIRESFPALADVWPYGILFLFELALLAVPMVFLMLPAVRGSVRGLFVSSLLIVLGVIVNRLNVVWIAYQPPGAEYIYFPSAAEWVIGIGLVATLVLCFRVAVTYLPVITHGKEA